jgi:pimeloyl-ACP methyl ester carboxylesterase
MSLTDREDREVQRANAAGRTPVVFVHGLWLLPVAWQPWRTLFEEHGYATLAPDWPDDPATVADARAHPASFAGKKIKQVTDHMAEVIGRLTTRPAVIGHSFGGLITQQLAGRGLAAVSVPIDPAPFRGVLPLPFSELRSAWPVVGNPANYRRAVSLTYRQFRYSFANTVNEPEAKELYEAHSVAGSGKLPFQAAMANFNPGSQAKVDTANPDRGPMLLIGGEKDHVAPWAVTNASYRRQRRNRGLTTVHKMPNRGHSLVLDSGWREVADVVLAFLKEHN